MLFKPGTILHVIGLCLVALLRLSGCSGEGTGKDHAKASTSAAQKEKPSPKKARKKKSEEKKKRSNEKNNSFIVTGKYDGPNPAGRWGEQRVDSGPRLASWQQEQFDKLEAMGYVQGSQKALKEGGITRYVHKKTQDGLNFYISGHDTVAYLMDMEGKVLHQWRFPFKKAWNKYPGHVNAVHSLFWRRAYLYENGDLLCIFEGMGMIKIDKDSNLIWKSPLHEHHDMTVADNGDIYTLTREGHIIERINPKKPVVEDFLTVLDSDGNLKKRVSLIEAMERSPEPMPYWDKKRLNKGDIFHTNTVFLLDGKIAQKMPAFTAGRVLVSMFYLNAIFVVDVDKEQMVWGYADDFKTQHDPHILPNGHLLLFDNQGGDRALGGSRILEYALPQMKRVWTYEGTETDKFFTRTCGTVQRLANGNTLITETDNGRAFEVTRLGKIVWEFISPHRAGPNNELVASLFEMKRIPKSYAAWLK